jgi:23S rRNA (adenine1618-N6)-methyltransferase
MSGKKKPKIKSKMHPRNKNRERYDLKALILAHPELKDFIKPNKHGDDSIDFSNPKAVKVLNRSLLKHYYKIDFWEFPDHNLCPPIPGRADYIHYLADLIRENNFGRAPEGNKIKCLDIGVGASCIYPIIGITEYNWNFIASDIDELSIENANKIVSNNTKLLNKVNCKLQKDSKAIYRGIIGSKDKIDITMCNPPFHESQEAAQKGSLRKVQNLGAKKVKNAELNFAGIHNELIYEGGEIKFISAMVLQSKTFKNNCFWFTTLVSKQSNLNAIYNKLDQVNASEIKTIPMGTGNKVTRIVAWTFLSKSQQNQWQKDRWN